MNQSIVLERTYMLAPNSTAFVTSPICFKMAVQFGNKHVFGSSIKGWKVGQQILPAWFNYLAENFS